MTDLYLDIAGQPDEVLDAVSASMDTRAAEPAMRRICEDYLGRLPRPDSEVLEVGCGNGATTALMLEALAPSRLVGVDPSAGLVLRAQVRHRDVAQASFEIGDAETTRQPDAAFDVTVAHTVYSHLPSAERALAEAWRTLRPGGTLSIFDGDYATNTVALFDGDPLQAAMTVTQRNLIHDPYVMRRLPGLVRDAGFVDVDTRAYGYVQTEGADYLRSLIARGVSAATTAGEIGVALAQGFEAEAARRVADGTFYGAILFVSLIARKPDC